MIVYADNNRLSRDLMKRLIGGLGLDHRLLMFQNGQQVVEYFRILLAAKETSIEPNKKE